MNYIFIKGNVPSSKNSKIWTGRFLISSKVTRDYEKQTGLIWKTEKKAFQEIFETNKLPITIGLYFVRKSKHRFDYINACQIIADLMVKYEWITDDNSECFVPIFLGFHYDSKNDGVYIVKPNFTQVVSDFTRCLVSEIKN